MPETATFARARFPAVTPWQATLLLVLGVAVLHALVAGRFALGVDEAHYALYGLKPALSYFDHPPLVGWMQALALGIGSNEYTLRLWPMLLSLLSALVLHRLTRELLPEASPWTPFVAVAIFESGLLFQLLALALVPDDPLLLFSLLATLFTYRAVNRGGLGNWLALGLWLGLAGLSKYTAVTLVVTVLGYLLWQRRGRLLATPGPWLAALLALLLITPVLYWNWQHDWVSFRYQLGHGAPDRSWELARFFKAQGFQFAAYSPGIYVGGLIAAFTALRRGEAGDRLLLMLGLPVLLLFGWNAGLQTSLPHWTSVGWAALTPLLARALLRGWGRRLVRVGTWASGLYSLLLLGVIFSQLFTPWVPFKPYRNPLGDLYGWREAAQVAGQLRQRMAQQPGPAPVLFVGNWSLASRIAWYDRPAPVVVVDKRFDQFDLWFGPPQPDQRGILIVPDKYQGRDDSGLKAFDHCEQRMDMTIQQHNTPVHSFVFYACRGYHG